MSLGQLNFTKKQKLSLKWYGNEDKELDLQYILPEFGAHQRRALVKNTGCG
jgi:hypothetical protein